VTRTDETEHSTLDEEATILDRAERAAARGMSVDTTTAIVDACRYLEDRFLPHAREDEATCLRLALRDHRHPEGGCGEPEIKALTTRLETLRDALVREGPAPALAEPVRTLLRELAVRVRAHVGTRAG
jgi:hypothetical protein